jgi:ketosteroid isomerase-like protein
MTLPDDLGAALDDLTQALAAMGSGDPGPYAALWADDGDVTLFGAWGPIERGFTPVTRTFDWVASRFSHGALVPRHEVIGHSGDLAYTVGFELGQVSVDGSDAVGMTLRVTHILRRVGGTWRIVHRHADFPPTDQRHTARADHA